MVGRTNRFKIVKRKNSFKIVNRFNIVKRRNRFTDEVLKSLHVFQAIKLLYDKILSYVNPYEAIYALQFY